ncbi:energy transducer TonB [Marinobacter psychrophilus]|uniref:energy transducer TonB n=1 Tax=Marinobacter psychrophilus TaxID=330734 RepID=UPI001B47293B|nr:TonB family protein [Marinobacter psychrophilus]MBQ0764127.1 energy transducer TonB [Marinobacter psychrophilus]MBQ0844907.1 energy transducer TonB [Marinobacter psychrophilus]
MAVQVSDVDRFSFTLFMALAIHGVIVLGITFAPETPPPSAQTMEITLSRFADEKAPEKADFLAPTNQQGSGSEEQAKELTSPQSVELNQTEVAQVQPEPQAQPEPQPVQQQAVVSTQASSTRQITKPEIRAEAVKELPTKPTPNLLQRSLEIASLEARLDAQQQAYSRRPRVLQVTASSTLQSSNAWYVQNWVSKVTRVGNMNYPAEARSSGLYGDLRLLVTLRKDGSLKEVLVMQSSGSTLLDDAAIRIVRLAAPYPPFPEEMSRNVDELEIIRTWSFQQRGLTSR